MLFPSWVIFADLVISTMVNFFFLLEFLFNQQDAHKIKNAKECILKFNILNIKDHLIWLTQIVLLL